MDGHLNHGRVLRLSAMRYRDQPCLEFRRATYTFGELNAQVNRTAHALAARGIRAGDRVLSLSANSPDYVRLVFAVAKLGAVAVPTSTGLLDRDLAAVVAAAEPALILADDPYLDRIATAAPAGTPVLRLGVDGDGELTGDDDTEPSVRAVDDTDPAVLLFTSGSTGTPKAVVKTFANFTWSALNHQISEPRREGDRELFVLPMTGIGLANFLLNDVMTGATCVLEPRFDPARAGHLLATGRISHAFLAPTMIVAIDGVTEDARFPDVTVLETAYEIPMAQRERVAALFPRARIHYSYGCTEGSMARAPADAFLGDPTCVGFAMGLDEYRVVDGPASREEPGPVEVGGPTVMRGYLGSDGTDVRDGWYDMGDLGWVDDGGRLHFAGRRKDMIKTGAMNVYARDVEDALATHPAVRGVAVVGVPDDYWGEAVVAVVEPAPGVPLDPADLRAHATAHLAGFRRPKAYYRVAALPLNATGKLNKGHLREMVLAGEVDPL